MPFKTDLDVDLIDDCYWRLVKPLFYWSPLVQEMIIVPTGFETDFASVPRLPIIFTLWGDRAHREAVVHDYLYCFDSVPRVCIKTANKVFLEAMRNRNKPWYVRYPMYWAVCMFGRIFYHQRSITSKFKGEECR